MEIKTIGVHHFGNNLTFAQLESYHKSRWPDLPSRLNPNWYTGYNFVIWRDGSWTQTRFIGEETAAAKGANIGAIHIALNGDFNTSKPTFAQIDTLKRILTQIKKKDLGEFKVLAGTSVNIKEIKPHKLLGTTITDCYGTQLKNDWASLLVQDEIKPLPLEVTPEITHLQNVLETLKRLIEKTLLLNKIKLGSQNKVCGERD